MRTFWIASAVVLLVLGGAACWYWTEPELSTSTPTADRASASSTYDEPFVKTVDEFEAEDAGFGLVTGHVLDPDGKPVEGATVGLYNTWSPLDELECPICHANVLECEDPSTVKRVAASLRDGTFKPPVPLAEARTGPDGAFTFENAPLNGYVHARSGNLSTEGNCEAQPLELMLIAPEPVEFQVRTCEGEPLPTARVSVYSTTEGSLEEFRPDAEGRVRVTPREFASWFLFEADGMLPQATRSGFPTEFNLCPPRTLVVRTKLGGQPVEADVTVELHGEARPRRSKNGVLTLENLPNGFYTVGVAGDGLAAPEQSVELVQPVTEIEFELRRSAKVFVTAVTELGEPLESVSASLNNHDTAFQADAENGALLVLGPVPEGEYTLTVSAEGKVPVEKQLDLKPGETTLEVTLRTAPHLKGKVVDPTGKPVEHARVTALDEGQEIAAAVTEEDGAFELELKYAGPLKLTAERQDKGQVQQAVTAPSEGVVLQLAERGVLEVEVFDFDGTQVAGNVNLRGVKDHTVRWIEAEEGQPGRIAGLPAGLYELDKRFPGRVTVHREVEIVEGRITKVTIKLDKGSTVSGRVIDAQGKPVAGAMVMVTGCQELADGTDEGTFEATGVPAGEVKVYAIDRNGLSSERVTVTAPARDVVLKFPESPRVKGRVVDEDGNVVKVFEANGQSFKTDDGRFEVAAPNESLEVYADGFSPTYNPEPQPDVGDVVMKKFRYIEGTVVDPDGKPVAGASVTSSMDMMAVSSDGLGHFKVPANIDAPPEGEELTATRGSMAGMTTARPGTPARIVLQRGSVVVGRVVDGSGRGVQTVVTATPRTAMGRNTDAETEADGRFQLELAQGLYSFSTRTNRNQRTVEVRGDRVEVTLGEEGSCGIVVTSPIRMYGAYLLGHAADESNPEALTAEAVMRQPGAIELPSYGPMMQISGRGLACGRYVLFTVGDFGYHQVPIDLRGAAQPVAISPAPPPEPEEPVDSLVQGPNTPVP